MGLLSKKQTDIDVDFTADFHFPTSTKALIIFTRNPELGKCKTRLAATVGDQSALDIYKFLLTHTAEITQNLKVDKFVYYSEALRKNDLWEDTVYTKRLQQGADLGARMNNAFSQLFNSGYKQAIIIGSDMYDLSQKDLENAFKQLDAHDYVIGPATDGGYYLLGMKTTNTAVFQNKDWGGANVLEQTLNELKNESVALLEERNDIDYYEDIQGHPSFQHLLPKEFRN